VVRCWNDEDGWGVIDCVDTRGGCWAHFSELDMAGFRKLDRAQLVDFAWQVASCPVECFGFVATKVRPVRSDL
jgi:cold shock protein